MNAKAVVVLVIIVLASVVSVSRAVPVENPCEWSSHPDGKVHYYERVDVPEGILWGDAKIEAESRVFNEIQGYLATITSGPENQFIFDNLLAADKSPISEKYWLGGFSDVVGFPGGIGQWITGEVWDYTNYTNWWITEPSGDGTVLEIASYLCPPESKWGTWNDEPSDHVRMGYIVEYVPEPATLLLLGLGGLVLLRKRMA